MNRLLSRMAKPGQKDPLDDNNKLKSPKKQSPVICYDSIFAENCDESIEEVAEEVMEMTEDVCMTETPQETSQEDISSEEEQTESPTIPGNLEEVDIYMVLLCWFGLACTAVHALCTGNSCRCQICQYSLFLRKNAIKHCEEITTGIENSQKPRAAELEPVMEVEPVTVREAEEESSQTNIMLQDDLV